MIQKIVYYSIVFFTFRRFRKQNEASEAVCGDMTKYYYDNHDLKLLLDLLDVNHGTATCLRILALFDSEFNDELAVPDIVFTTVPKFRTHASDQKHNDEEEKKVRNYDLEIGFQDAPLRAGILKYMNVTNFCYMVSLNPRTESTSCAQISVKSESKNSICSKNDDLVTTNPSLQYTYMLEDLDASQEYAIRIDTIVNGQTLGNRMEFFGPIKSKMR